jgi:hypothetical protein
VLVKRLIGSAPDVHRRLRRLAAMGECSAIPTPELLGVEEEHALVAHRYLDGARTGDTLVTDDAFDAGLMADAGRHLEAPDLVDIAVLAQPA